MPGNVQHGIDSLCSLGDDMVVTSNQSANRRVSASAGNLGELNATPHE